MSTKSFQLTAVFEREDDWFVATCNEIVTGNSYTLPYVKSSDTEGMRRRRFLKLAGFGITGIALFSCGILQLLKGEEFETAPSTATSRVTETGIPTDSNIVVTSTPISTPTQPFIATPEFSEIDSLYNEVMSFDGVRELSIDELRNLAVDSFYVDFIRDEKNIILFLSMRMGFQASQQKCQKLEVVFQMVGVFCWLKLIRAHSFTKNMLLFVLPELYQN